MRAFRIQPMRQIRVVLLALALLGSRATVFAASAYCTGGYGGMSVWCHTHWFNYTKCNIYDEAGDMVSEFVEPNNACAQIGALVN